MLSAALVATLIGGLAASSASAGGSLPVGGQVSSGAAAISKSAGNVTINQASNRAVINWSSFAVGAGNNVVFNQPSAQSATLNRVTGNATSAIAGQISSNGAVYLVNPNGIAISKSGSIQTGGGFIASSLDISDNDFNAGKLNFAGKGASATVSNAGHIAARNGAYVALLGGSVSNSGTIAVPYGRVGLGSAESIALDLNGGGFMQVALPTSALTGTAALIDNSGSVAASGGIIELRAATVKDAVRNVINMPGSLNADSATGNGGHITLFGGAKAGDWGGTVTASGTLSARATGSKGDGGLVETSGHTVNFAAITADTRAAHGKTGTWLVDPTDLTIAGSDARTISSNLLIGNVNLITNADGSTTGPGAKTPGAGDINIQNTITWNSGNTLTLSAFHSININANVNSSGINGQLILQSDNSGTGSGTVNIATDPASNPPTSFQISVTGTGSGTIIYYNPAVFGTPINWSGSIHGVLRAYQLVNSIDQLQAINGNTNGAQNLSNLTGSYALGRNIDASVTSTWNGGAGFIPLGTDARGKILNNLSGYSGIFEGQGHTISNLTIKAAPSALAVGLFGESTGVERNTGLVGGSITGAGAVGALVGFQNGGGLFGDFSTASVTDYGTSPSSKIGGLVGSLLNSRVILSNASGQVLGNAQSSDVGGLVGADLNTSITNAYATGNVSSTGASSQVGGLVGYQEKSTVLQTYAVGKVASSGAKSVTGGLIGAQLGGTTTNSYWDTQATGQSTSAGGLGETTAQMQDFNNTATNYAGFGFVGIWSPPNQLGQANQTAAHYPELYALSPVISTVAASASRQYGSPDPIFGYRSGGPKTYIFAPATDSLTGFNYGVTTATLASDANDKASGGTNVYPITANTVTNTTSIDGIVYRVIGSGSGFLTITQRTTLVNPNSITQVYGQPSPTTDTGTSGNLVNGDTLGQITVTSPATPTSDAGSYSLTATGATLSAGNPHNYIFTYATVPNSVLPNVLKITPRPIYVYTGDYNSIYGTSIPVIKYLAPSGDGFGLVNGDTLSGALSTDATNLSGVGSYKFNRGTLTTSKNISGQPVDYTFIINSGQKFSYNVLPRTLYIYTFDTQSVYGNTPNLSYASATGDSYGLVNGDTLNGNVTSSVTSTSPAGYSSPYDLSQLKPSTPNYVIANQTPLTTVSVTQRPLYVYAANNTDSTYGSTPVFYPFIPTGGNYGLVNGAVLPSGLLGGATATSNVGVYKVTADASKIGPNYSLIYQTPNSTVTVNPRTLYIYNFNTNSVYGNAPNISYYNPSGANYGLVNGDKVTGALSDATAMTGVGQYSITLGTLNAGSNYIFSYQTPNTFLTINPRPLQVIGNNASRPFGTSNPIFTYTIPPSPSNGLLFNDTLSGALTSLASLNSPAGNYSIDQGTLGSPNYIITYTPGTLTVN